MMLWDVVFHCVQRNVQRSGNLLVPRFSAVIKRKISFSREVKRGAVVRSGHTSSWSCH